MQSAIFRMPPRACGSGAIAAINQLLYMFNSAAFGLPWRSHFVNA
jgi:hypothetical protein